MHQLLVVDDEPTIRNLLERVFKRDYNVILADSAETAREIIMSRDIDVILTDMIMGGESGADLLKWVVSSVPMVVVILMTGHADVAIAVETMKSGAFDFITKPFENLDDIRRIVGHAFEKRRLLRENDELKELNKLKDDFVNVMAHELRTPVTILNGYMNILKDLKADSFEEAYTEVVKSINWLTRLIEDVLLVIATEDASPHLEITDFTLDDMMAELLSDLNFFLSRRKVAFNWTADIQEKNFTGNGSGGVHGGGLMISADRAKINKALFNLSLNAIKFTPDGGSVSISCSVEGTELVFRVSDTGIGIPSSQWDKVFRKFAVLHDPFHHTSGVYEFKSYGCGLGLSIVKGIAEMHGGRVWFRSEEGKGSDFFLAIQVHSKP